MRFFERLINNLTIIGEKEVSLNLDDYYYDPDGLKAEYSDFSFNGKGTLYSCEENGNILTFAPLSKGEGSISFTVSDHVNEKTVTVNVEVLSGKAVFWAENWIWFALALLGLAIVIFTLMTIAKNTRVKGNWEIRLSDEIGNSLRIPEVNIRSNTSVGRKKKCFTVEELLDEAECIAEREGNMYEVIHQYPELRALKLKGVSFGTGCKILNIPKRDGVTASCNGVPVTSKARPNAGSFEMRVTPADAATAIFTLRYLGKF